MQSFCKFDFEIAALKQCFNSGILKTKLISVNSLIIAI